MYYIKNLFNSNYIDSLKRHGDVIYLCLSINDDTKNIITDGLLNKLKNDAIFISCTGKSLFNYRLIEEKIKNSVIRNWLRNRSTLDFLTAWGTII